MVTDFTIWRIYKTKCGYSYWWFVSEDFTYLSNILSPNYWICVYKTTSVNVAFTSRNYFTLNSMAQEIYTVSSSNIIYLLSLVALPYYKQIKVKVKWSRYRPGVAQRVGRGTALLLHDHGTRRGWVVSSTPRPQFTPGKDPVPILQEAGWALGSVWTGRKFRPHQDSIPDRPARSQSLYRLSYRANILKQILFNIFY